ncbi:MAG: DUF4147 domain-containing protein [Fimbriimonas sp.]
MTAESALRRMLSHVLADIRGDTLVRRVVTLEDDGMRVGSMRVPWPKGKLRIHGAGKAAAAMASGLHGLLGDRVESGLLILKDEAPLGDPFECLQSSHPHLDERSLEAGERMFAAAQACGPDDLVLFVLSGGASALMELPRQGISLDDLKRQYREWFLAGLPIDEMNRRRASVSALKGGGLGAAHGSARVVVLVLSDVRGNDLRVIGSGPLFGPRPHVLVGDASVALKSAVESLPNIDLAVHPEFLTGDANTIEFDFTRSFVCVGEPTLAIPPNAPAGGRAQHLALRCVPTLPPGSAFLALGTDGSDGPTPIAGALVTPDHYRDNVSEALRQFDATRFLGEVGALLTTGATGSNVNDLYAFIRDPAR